MLSRFAADSLIFLCAPRTPSRSGRVMIASLRNTTFLAATAFLVASTVSAQEPDAGRFTGSLRGSSGATGGSMTRVAEKTGLERTHLYRKLKQLGVEPIKASRKSE